MYWGCSDHVTQGRKGILSFSKGTSEQGRRLCLKQEWKLLLETLSSLHILNKTLKTVAPRMTGEVTGQPFLSLSHRCVHTKQGQLNSFYLVLHSDSCSHQIAEHQSVLRI